MMKLEEEIEGEKEDMGIIKENEDERIMSEKEKMENDMEKMEKGKERDGVVVKEIVRNMRKNVGEEVEENVNLGEKSKDVIEKRIMMRIERVRDIIVERIEKIQERLKWMEKNLGKNDLKEYKRMKKDI